VLNRTVYEMGSRFPRVVCNLTGMNATNADQDIANDYESSAIVLGKDGKQITQVLVRVSPKYNSGDFRLPSLDAGRDALTVATSLKLDDGKVLQLHRLRICPAVHLVNPQEAHMEFDLLP
jgi:hypothetical protein